MRLRQMGLGLVFGIQLALAGAAVAQADIVRLSQVAPGVFRGGQPENEQDYRQLKALGIKTVINLRTSDELIENEQKSVLRLGMRFENYPINSFTYPEENEVAQILNDMVNPSLMPVFIHCHHGKDRTGMVVGLYRVHVQGWDPSRAYAEMEDFGFTRLLYGLYAFYWNHVPSTR